jgi:Uma2 family endonuclease
MKNRYSKELEVNLMATAGTQRMTLEEFRALPEGPPNFEFEEGELIPVPSPTPKHQDILLELGHFLKQFVRQNKIGQAFMGVDVFLPDGRCFIPDLTFLSSDRLNLVSPEDEKIHGTPTLVVEITSSEPERDRVHKFRVYYENGVPWYWIVDSETLTIEEYQATSEGYVRKASIGAKEGFGPRVFPGLVINLAALLGSPS